MGYPSWLQSEETPIDPAAAAAAQRRQGGFIDPTQPSDPSTGMPPPPGAPPQAQQAPVPTQPAIPPGTETSNDEDSRVLQESALNNFLLGGPAGPQAPGPTVMPGMSDYTPLGGAEGKNVFDETFVKGPERYRQALADQGQVEENLGNAKADFYKRNQQTTEEELAALQARRHQDQANIAAQQQQIEQATQRYSDDLADQGKFWKEPAHVMGAIAASLMALGSGGPTIGLKLINDAVNSDFQQRKQLADMHLGELRSNLGQYRQIAGDRDLGDRLALAESQRVAAMELERIAGQFQGPLAKTRAAALSEALMQQSNMTRMQMYAASVNNKPRLENPLLAKEYKAMGQAMPGVGPTPYKGTFTPGAVQPTGATGQAGKPSPQVYQATAAAKGGPDKGFELTSKLMEERAPGSSGVLKTIWNDVERDASIEAGRQGLTDPMHKKQLKLKIIQKAQADADKIGQLAVEKGAYDARAWGEMAKDIKRVKAAAQLAGKTPDEFLGDMRNMVGPGWSNYIQNLRVKYANSDTPEAKQALENLKASERFHQMLANNVVDFYHNKFGGAMSKEELALGAGVIDPTANFSKIEGFADMGSKTAGRQWNAILKSTSGLPALMLRARYGVGSPSVDSPGTK